MPSQNVYLHVPLEIVRTIVAIAETGSLTKAGERLGLTQPAVSAQMKRIQNMLGGEIFTKSPNGSVPTSLGILVLSQARKMLDANDQILRLVGTTSDGPQPLRFGISALLVKEFLQHETAETLDGTFMFTEHSVGVAKALIEGYIDVGCIFENSAMGAEISDLIVKQRDEPMVWVRSRDFVPAPGATIPLLTWPGDDLKVRALVKSGIPYKIVFNSADHYARVAALERGIGLAALPRRSILPPLVEAKEDYLPPLPPVKILLCARPDLENPHAEKLLKRLAELFFEPRQAR